MAKNKVLIIGLVGQTGSGKDTFSDYLLKNYKNVFSFRFSQTLSEVLGIFFSDIKKADQQWLASCLRERFGNNILGIAIKRKIESIKKGIVVLNGIRDFEELEMIKKMGGKIIHIEVDSKTRWQRVRKRGEKKDDNSSYKKFLEMEKAKSEIFIKKIAKQADFKIENNGSKRYFYQNIKKIIDKII